MFLRDLPDPAAVTQLDAGRSAPDRFRLLGREVYLHTPNGFARTRLTNAWFDSKLSTVGTTRNWRTTVRLTELMKS